MSLLGDGIPKADDSRVLGWLKECVQEGDRINRSDAEFPRMDAAMDYVMGNQIKGNQPSYVPRVVCNQTKKAIATHVAALTDIGSPSLFAYKSFNEKFQDELQVLNRYVHVWWVNTDSDMRLAQAIQYALTLGTADITIEYDPFFNMFGPNTFGQGGDTKLTARDPRDTLPFRPSKDLSIQAWEGVVIREEVSPNALSAIYPVDKMSFKGEGTWGQLFTKFRRFVGPTVATSTLDGLSGKGERGSASGGIPLYRCYVNDRSINLNSEPVLMGNPGTNWSYVVQPGKPLYPRKRLIVSIEKRVLYDGPNPYWHGMYPIGRLKLESWPWQFLGTSLVHDLMPLQDALNSGVNDIISVIKQWVRRSVKADAQGVPKSVLDRFDPNRPGSKIQHKAGTPGIELLDGPNLPAYALPFLEFLFAKFDSLSDVANLQSLMQLKQMPGADTIEAFYKALTPTIKMEARMIEIFLRDVGEMVKCNVFQYADAPRRMLLLGSSGKALSDFDYDPSSLVPAMDAADPRYQADLDKSKSREERAQFFMKLFAFYVSPNSLNNMHTQSKKLEALQLSRAGLLDIWTLAEILEIENYGTPPPIALPPLDWSIESGMKDPETGAPMPPPLMIRTPNTVVERLMAQQELGIGLTVSPAGRKATATAPPKQADAGGGRQTIRESR